MGPVTWKRISLFYRHLLVYMFQQHKIFTSPAKWDRALGKAFSSFYRHLLVKKTHMFKQHKIVTSGTKWDRSLAKAFSSFYGHLV